MPDRLLRSQLNQVIRSLLEAGLPREAIDLDRGLAVGTLAIELPLRISVKNTAFYYEIHFLWGPYQGAYFPGNGPSPEFSGLLVWSNLVADLCQWAKRVCQELSEPDPWSLLNEGEILAGEILLGEEGSGKFDQRELQKLNEFVQQVKEFILSEVKPSADQFALMEKQLRYLEESAKSQDKKAWTFTAIGVMFTIATALSLSPEQGRALFVLTAEFLRTIFVKLLS